MKLSEMSTNVHGKVMDLKGDMRFLNRISFFEVDRKNCRILYRSSPASFMHSVSCSSTVYWSSLRYMTKDVT